MTIVRAGLLYDGTLEPPKSNVDLVVEEGRVAEIRAATGPCDLEAACVTPGLVNAHAHLEASGEPDLMGAFQTTPANERLLNAVANARKSIRAGVTTIRDVGSSNAFAQSVRDAIEAGKIPGPRMRAAGAVICMTGGHGWPIGRMVDSPWDTRKAVREQMWAGADCIKFIATGGVLTKGAVPGNAQLTPDELEAGVDEAHRHGLKVAAHAIGTVGIKNALARRRRFGRACDAARRRSDRTLQTAPYVLGTNAQRADLHPRAFGRRTAAEVRARQSARA